MRQEMGELLFNISLNCEVIAEKSIEKMVNSGQKEKVNKLKEVLMKYKTITDKIKSKQPLEQKEYLYLWTGAQLASQLINSRALQLQKVVESYQDAIIPLLLDLSKANDETYREELLENFFNDSNFDKIKI